ncbi:hypothetical protein [Candidatus Cytomitobacter indipagum]|nr:hypothetical protein [Candidatus Cytomitobacter indipagum]
MKYIFLSIVVLLISNSHIVADEINDDEISQNKIVEKIYKRKIKPTISKKNSIKKRKSRKSKLKATKRSRITGSKRRKLPAKRRKSSASKLTKRSSRKRVRLSRAKYPIAKKLNKINSVAVKISYEDIYKNEIRKLQEKENEIRNKLIASKNNHMLEIKLNKELTSLHLKTMHYKLLLNKPNDISMQIKQLSSMQMDIRNKFDKEKDQAQKDKLRKELHAISVNINHYKSLLNRNRSMKSDSLSRRDMSVEVNFRPKINEPKSTEGATILMTKEQTISRPEEIAIIAPKDSVALIESSSKIENPARDSVVLKNSEQTIVNPKKLVELESASSTITNKEDKKEAITLVEKEEYISRDEHKKKTVELSGHMHEIKSEHTKPNLIEKGSQLAIPQFKEEVKLFANDKSITSPIREEQKKIIEEEKQQQSATKIQALFRGRSARKATEVKKVAEAEEKKLEEARLSEEENRKLIKSEEKIDREEGEKKIRLLLEKLVEIKDIRATTDKRKERNKKSEEEKETRKEVEIVERKEIEELKAKEERARKEVEARLDTEEKAATKIQALFRGRSVRKATEKTTPKDIERNSSSAPLTPRKLSFDSSDDRSSRAESVDHTPGHEDKRISRGSDRSTFSSDSTSSKGSKRSLTKEEIAKKNQSAKVEINNNIEGQRRNEAITRKKNKDINNRKKIKIKQNKIRANNRIKQNKLRKEKDLRLFGRKIAEETNRKQKELEKIRKDKLDIKRLSEEESRTRSELQKEESSGRLMIKDSKDKNTWKEIALSESDNNTEGHENDDESMISEEITQIEKTLDQLNGEKKSIENGIREFKNKVVLKNKEKAELAKDLKKLNELKKKSEEKSNEKTLPFGRTNLQKLNEAVKKHGGSNAVILIASIGEKITSLGNEIVELEKNKKKHEEKLIAVENEIKSKQKELQTKKSLLERIKNAFKAARSKVIPSKSKKNNNRNAGSSVIPYYDESREVYLLDPQITPYTSERRKNNDTKSRSPSGSRSNSLNSPSKSSSAKNKTPPKSKYAHTIYSY